jgi:hypothetical protein
MGGVVQKSFLGAIALFALLLSPAAWASRQKITDSIEINAPPAKVWAGIADVHDMSWHSGVTKTTARAAMSPMSPTPANVGQWRNHRRRIDTLERKMRGS